MKSIIDPNFSIILHLEYNFIKKKYFSLINNDKTLIAIIQSI